MRCAVYRARNASGELLYVGQSRNWGARWSHHADRSEWFEQVASLEIQWLDSIDDAVISEAAAIRDERPKFNKVGATRTGGGSGKTAEIRKTAEISKIKRVLDVLFESDEELSKNEVVRRARMSRSRALLAIKTLQELGAIKPGANGQRVCRNRQSPIYQAHLDALFDSQPDAPASVVAG